MKRAADAELRKLNPLGKIPALVLDDGSALFDSPVICEYLNELGGGKFFPGVTLFERSSAGRWKALDPAGAGRRHLADAAVAPHQVEAALPEERRNADAIARHQTSAIEAALAVLEALALREIPPRRRPSARSRWAARSAISISVCPSSNGWRDRYRQLARLVRDVLAMSVDEGDRTADSHEDQRQALAHHLAASATTRSRSSTRRNCRTRSRRWNSRTMDDAAHAIKAMIVRGAPLIGATAAYGIALAMREDASDEALDRAHDMLAETRPTAINLRWALKRDARCAAQPAARAARRARLDRGREDRRRRCGDLPLASASTGLQDPARGGGEEERRNAQHPHPLQRGLARLRRLGHGAGADLHGA